MSHDDLHRALREFYDGTYYAGVAEPASPTLHLRRLARRLVMRPGTAVLDVACGAGDWLVAAHQRGANVTGIDISAKAISVAARRLPDGDFTTGVAENLPYANGKFELVTCLGALEHFPDKPAALREMRRVLRPGGRILVLVPNAGFLTRRLGLFSGTEQSTVREDVLSLAAWQALFEASGLRTERCWRDLHVFSRGWLMRQGWRGLAPRLAQALALAVWPLRWQYQVYHLLTPAEQER